MFKAWGSECSGFKVWTFVGCVAYWGVQGDIKGLGVQVTASKDPKLCWTSISRLNHGLKPSRILKEHVLCHILGSTLDFRRTPHPVTAV